MNPTAEHAEHTDPATTKPEGGGKRVGKRVLEYIFAVGLLLLAAYLCKVAIDVRENNQFYEIIGEANDVYNRIVEERGISDYSVDEEGKHAPWWWNQMTLPVAEADDPLGPFTEISSVS